MTEEPRQPRDEAVDREQDVIAALSAAERSARERARRRSAGHPPRADMPPLLRFILWAGRPLGIAFVPEEHVQVINRMGRYSGCKGPGLIVYNRLTETRGPLVFTGADVGEYRLDNVLARDMVPVTVTVAATYRYAPDDGPEYAPIITRMTRTARSSIIETFLRWGLLALANQYNSSELTQHAVHAQLEAAVGERVNSELAFLGLRLLGKLRVLSVALPAGLTERHELLAQRRASILAGAEFHPAEYRRALVSEVIEHIGRMGGNESFVNFGEMLEAYATERRGELPPPPRIIELGRTPPEDRGAPPPEPPAASGAEDEPGPRRPKSRL